jgi:AmmeMemoRadiSam system protein B
MAEPKRSRPNKDVLKKRDRHSGKGVNFSFIRNLGIIFLILLFVLVFGILWRIDSSDRAVELAPKASTRGLLIPHHLLAEDLITTGLERFVSEADEPQVLFLVVPNHAEAGDAVVVMREGAFDGCGMSWRVPEPMVRYDNQILRAEHAVVDIEPIVRDYFPQAVIVPVVVSNRAALSELESLAGVIESCAARFAVIASIDFSHYLTSSEAEVKDAETLQVIKARDYASLLGFGNDHLDAPAALTVFLQVMDGLGARGFERLDHTNSGELSGDRNASVTSYLVGVFR